MKYLKFRLYQLFCLIFLLTFQFAVLSQEKGKDYTIVSIGFYNVENLFDTINTPEIKDEEFTPEGKNKWGSERYLDKLDKLSEVMEAMAIEKTPDGCAVMGLAEIENRDVIEDLVNTERLKPRNYEIVHYDSPDKRGVDVGLIYQPKYFKVESSKSYTLTIEGKDDFYTRDQLLVSGDFLGERFHFIVAHWPSRRGGEKRSSPLREAAAGLARSIIDSIQVAENNQANVVLMGDLNDDPSNKSVKEVIKTQRKEKKMSEDFLFNPFEDFYRKGIGTLAWRDTWNLFDQIMLTNNIVGRDDFSTFKYFSAVVYNKPFLRQSSGRFEGYPYRSFAGGQYLGGYSDHFPVYIYLLREIN